MANPSDIKVRGDARSDDALGEIAALRREFNKLVTNLRVLTAKLDADAGVTDVNYATLVTDSAASGPAKITTIYG